MTHICAGKISVQENIAPVDGYVHLVHIFKRRPTWHGTSRNHLYVKSKNTQEMKYVWLTIKFNYFVLPASVGVSYVATQFHVSNSDGLRRKNFATNDSRNVSSKINVKPSKVQIPISFLIIWIFWSNKNEFTLHIMTCMKIKESQKNLKMAKFTPKTHFPMARLKCIEPFKRDT